MLLSTAHFPPIQYFSKIVDLDSFVLESKENYQKRSYRNRYRIYGANGPINLSVPIIKSNSPERLIKEVKVDSSYNWQKIHLKSIQSSYRHSPFYEFYFDEFKPYWDKQWSFLFDLNLNILQSLIEILELDIDIRETTEYMDIIPDGQPDFRKIIHPKKSWKQDTAFTPQPYTQNFSDRYGFQANLSIIDLIFQTGPEALRVLKESVITSELGK